MIYEPKTFHPFKGKNKDKIPSQYDGQIMYTFEMAEKHNHKMAVPDYVDYIATHTIYRGTKADYDTRVLIDLTSEDLVHLALLGVRIGKSDPRYLEVYLTGKCVFTRQYFIGG